MKWGRIALLGIVAGVFALAFVYIIDNRRLAAELDGYYRVLSAEGRLCQSSNPGVREGNRADCILFLRSPIRGNSSLRVSDGVSIVQANLLTSVGSPVQLLVLHLATAGPLPETLQIAIAGRTYRARGRRLVEFHVYSNEWGSVAELGNASPKGMARKYVEVDECIEVRGP